MTFSNNIPSFPQSVTASDHITYVIRRECPHVRSSLFQFSNFDLVTILAQLFFN